MQGAKRNVRAGINGQSTAEYAIVLGVVIAAIVAMQIYVKRGAQGRMKMVTDRSVTTVLTRLKGGAPAPKELQYEPYYTSSTYNITQQSGQKEDTKLGGVVERTGVTQETTRTGSQLADIARDVAR